MASATAGGGDVAAPTRARGGDLGQEGQVGEADGVGGGGGAAARRRGRPGPATSTRSRGEAPGSEEVHRRRLLATTKRTTSKSQSRSVDRTRWAAPRAPHRPGVALGLLGGGGLGEAGPQLAALEVCTSSRWPVSGSTSMSRPTAGRSLSRGSRTSTTTTSWRRASARSSRCQGLSSSRSVMRTTRPRRLAVSRMRRSASARVVELARRRRPGSRCSSRWQQGQRRRPAGAGRDDGGAVGPEAPGGDPVAVADGEEGEGGRRGQGQVALLAVGGAEVEAGGAVDHQPGLQLPVGDGGPHVGDAGAGGEVPVHAADVVARGVDPAVGRLGAPAGHEALVVALEEPVELAGDGQLQLAQPVLPADDVGGASPGLHLPAAHDARSSTRSRNRGRGRPGWGPAGGRGRCRTTRFDDVARR